MAKDLPSAMVDNNSAYYKMLSGAAKTYESEAEPGSSPLRVSLIGALVCHFQIAATWIPRDRQSPETVRAEKHDHRHGQVLPAGRGFFSAAIRRMSWFSWAIVRRPTEMGVPYFSDCSSVVDKALNPGRPVRLCCFCRLCAGRPSMQARGGQAHLSAIIGAPPSSRLQPC